MNLQYQYYRTDCVLRTLYIGGVPPRRGHKVRGDPRQLPPRGAREARAERRGAANVLRCGVN